MSQLQLASALTFRSPSPLWFGPSRSASPLVCPVGADVAVTVGVSVGAVVFVAVGVFVGVGVSVGVFVAVGAFVGVGVGIDGSR